MKKLLLTSLATLALFFAAIGMLPGLITSVGLFTVIYVYC